MEIKDQLLTSSPKDNMFFKSFQKMFIDLKNYVIFSIIVFIAHSILLYIGSYLWVNYNGIYKSQAFLNAFIHVNFDIDYLFCHNLWCLSLRVHLVVSLICLIYAIICKFFLIKNYYYEVTTVIGKLLIWVLPNVLLSAIFIENSYIFDYQTSVMICSLPGLLMTHPSMIVVRSIIPDLGDIHRFFLWCIYRNKIMVAQT
jgi:magnesium-transporting ATPase (P-type)